MNHRSALGAVVREVRFLSAVLGLLVTFGCILGAAWGLLTYSEDKL